MGNRIDEYLDGALPGGALTPGERADVTVTQHAIDDTRAFIAARPVPDMRAAVMRQVAKAGPPAVHPRMDAFVAWVVTMVWAPRQVSFRPVYGMLAAAALLISLVGQLPIWSRTQDGIAAVADAGRPAPVFVQFRVQTNASSVQLAGSFTDWQPRYDLHQAAPGIWSVTVPLSDGVHDYAFIVDGERWIADPYAAQIGDGFGGVNSRLTLMVPEGRRE